MKELFLQLFWPATAGNVAWSFFSLAVNDDWCHDGVLARLIALLFLAWYLAVNWIRLQSIDYMDVKLRYWFADALHLTTVIVFAIAAQLNKTWLLNSLEFIFVASIIGHLTGAWVNSDEPHWDERLWLAGANLIGLIVIAIKPVFDIQYPSILPIALGSTLISWYIVRNYVMKS